MVDMNPEHIFEVPDTPDRIQQSACPVSSSAATRGVTRMAGNPSLARGLKFKIKTNSNQGQSSRGDATSERPTALDTDNFFKQAELAWKLSPPKLDRTIGKSVVNGNVAHSHDLDKSSSILNHTIRRGDGVRGNSCQIREGQVGPQDTSHRHVDSLGVGSDLPNITVGKPQNRARISTSNGLKEVVGSDVEKREAISSTPCDVPQRQVVRRKLVRNGCISPSSVVKRSVIADEKREMCSTSGVLHYPNPQDDVSHKGNIIDLTDKSPTMTRNGVSVNYMETTASEKFRRARAGGTLIPQGANQTSSSNCSEGFNTKGKEIIHHMGTERVGEADTMRVCPRPAVGSSSVVNDNNTGISQQGWRTTHNHYSKLPMPLLGKSTSTSGMESGSSGPFNQGHETAAGDNNSFSTATTVRSAGLRSRTIRISNGKRKHTSSSCHPGESSSSLNEVGGSCLAPSDTTVGRNHTTLRHSTPVIDIDDISSPEVRSSLRGLSNGTSIGPNVSAQLEADELLARQLQEQLYNETPRVAPREEIDAIVALSLQHEEDAARTSRTVRAPVRRLSNDTRAARASRLSASQRAIRARYEPAISHMRNGAPITLGLRAFVAGYPASHIQPNIDLNDYDALLALDENNHQHTGASESQINNLPQSVFQSTSTEEPCAVCLENPSLGDTIRTLPCFHKFHKECIDEWLRRKKLCPVCKCGITS